MKMFVSGRGVCLVDVGKTHLPVMELFAPTPSRLANGRKVKAQFLGVLRNGCSVPAKMELGGGFKYFCMFTPTFSTGSKPPTSERMFREKGPCLKEISSSNHILKGIIFVFFERLPSLKIDECHLKSYHVKRKIVLQLEFLMGYVIFQRRVMLGGDESGRESEAQNARKII